MTFLAKGPRLLALALLFACALFMAGASPAGALDASTAPLVLKPGLTLKDQFGYQPDYTRNVPDFGPGDVPYIRSRTADIDRTSFVQTVVEGAWARFGLLDAVRAAYPTFQKTVNAAGWLNQHLVFDSSGRAYTVLTIRLSDGSQHNLLLASLDRCRTWMLAERELPAGEVTSESWVGHNQLDGPPFVMVFRLLRYHPSPSANYEQLLVTQPRWENGVLVVPEALTVSRNCFGVSAHSGGASMAVTRGGRTYFVWGEITARGGSPIYAAAYDSATGILAEKTILGRALPANDKHCTPAIATDSAGQLHVIVGSHNTALTYYRSRMPDTVLAGWDGPTPMLARAKRQVGVEQTYVGLVCDQNDTLHAVFRLRRQNDQYFGGAYSALAYQRKTRDGVWEEPQLLIVPAASGYTIYYHKLTMDHGGRLWVTASNVSGAEAARLRDLERRWRKRGRRGPRPGIYQHRLLMVADAGGVGWRLATDADLLGAPSVAASSVSRPAPVTTTPGARNPATLLRTGRGTWLWQAPQPQGNDLGAVWFANAKRGWAVGDAGTILRTEDGGTTWRSQPSRTEAQLFAVQFPKPAVGWVVGQGGTILKSANGGARWAPQRSGTKSTLYGCSFVDRNLGLVVGDGGTILKTSNGGRSWRSLRSFTSSALFAVSMISKDHAWVVGQDGLVLVTANGGRSWHRQYPPRVSQPVERKTARRIYPNLYDVHFTSRKVGFAVGDGCTLLVTRNGGASWSLRDLGVAETLYAVRFASTKVGWIAGTGGVVLRTADAGRTWRVTATPTKAALLGVACAGPARTWVVGRAGAILRGTGTKWRAARAGATEDLNAVAFEDARRGLAVGAAGMILTTADGGLGWTRRASGTDRALAAADAVGGARWVAGANGTLLRSVNAGASWTKAATGTSRDLNAVDFVDERHGWAAGAAGTLLRSTDGGATWTAQQSGVTVDLSAVSFADAQHGWAVGGDTWGEGRCVILRTISGGEDPDGGGPGAGWTVQMRGGWGILRGLAFASAREGWAVGGEWDADGDRPEGVVYHTQDGGQTWSAQYPGASGILTAVAALGDGVAVVAGEGGLLLKTLDGGATWKRLSSGCGNDLRGLWFAGSALGWAVGEGGSIIQTLNGGE